MRSRLLLRLRLRLLPRLLWSRLLFVVVFGGVEASSSSRWLPLLLGVRL